MTNNQVLALKSGDKVRVIDKDHYAHGSVVIVMTMLNANRTAYGKPCIMVLDGSFLLGWQIEHAA